MIDATAIMVLSGTSQTKLFGSVRSSIIFNLKLIFKIYNMNEQFVTYGIAKTLKELGFDKPCFGFYDDARELNCGFSGSKGYIYSTFTHNVRKKIVIAPLWQQVTEWFLEKHKMHVTAEPIYSNKAIGSSILCGYIKKVGTLDFNEEFETYHEARKQAVLEAIDLINKTIT